MASVVRSPMEAREVIGSKERPTMPCERQLTCLAYPPPRGHFTADVVNLSRTASAPCERVIVGKCRGHVRRVKKTGRILKKFESLRAISCQVSL